eukprot:g222.t1
MSSLGDLGPRSRGKGTLCGERTLSSPSPSFSSSRGDVLARLATIERASASVRSSAIARGVRADDVNAVLGPAEKRLKRARKRMFDRDETLGARDALALATEAEERVSAASEAIEVVVATDAFRKAELTLSTLEDRARQEGLPREVLSVVLDAKTFVATAEPRLRLMPLDRIRRLVDDVERRVSDARSKVSPGVVVCL